MINKLKRKFTALATISTFVLMTILVLIMNIVNFTSVVNESDTVLNVLSQPNTPFSDDKMPPIKPDGVKAFIPYGMSPEVPYESRYFSVTVSPDGTVKESNLSKIISVDENSSAEYIDKAMKSRSDRGFIDQFRYSKITDMQSTRIFFLDCGRKLDSFKSFMWTSIAVGIGGCIIVFVVFLFVSGKIVKPIAESYEKQKRFISDAGHEIKTPLTIINANIDLLESDGESEELTDIRKQTTRLTKLTNDLVYLSKMEESQTDIQKVDFPVSDLVSETANSFNAVASSGNIVYEKKIEQNLSCKASPDAIRQLASVLLDNAFKYSPKDGHITVQLQRKKKAIVFSVSNTTKEQINPNDLPYIFDRFYRTDASRNSQTGGHGIGLSIAKAITESHGGTVSASTKTGYDFCITVTIPQ